MTVLDYIVLIVILASAASGASKGIIKGVISVVSAVAGVIVAAHLYQYAGSVFSIFGMSERAASLAGFIAIFLLVVLLGFALTYALRKVLKRTRLSWADHLLGAGFGLLRGWLVCSALYLALTAFPVKIDAVQRAMFAPELLEGTRVIAYLTSRELRERFYEGYENIKRMWDPKSTKPTRPANAV